MRHPKALPLFGSEARSITETLRKHTDREAAIVSATLVELSLQKAVESKCIRDFDTNMFKPDRLLGTFGAKRAIAYNFGIIDAHIDHDLKIIASVRNHFAHTMQPITFETKGLRPCIEQQVRALVLPEKGGICLEGITNTPAPKDTKGFKFVIGDQVLADCTFSDDDVATPKGRYISAALICWVLLSVTTMHNSRTMRGIIDEQ